MYTKLRHFAGLTKQNFLRKNDIPHNLRKFQGRLLGPLPLRPDDYEKSIEIIIPCYNHASYLPNAIQSIVDQTWKYFPVLVTMINDNSTDETEQICKQVMRQQYPNLLFKYVKNKENLRQWASINHAISLSDNELIIILNDDDLLTADCLEKVLVTFTHYPDIFMVGGSSIWFQEKIPKHRLKDFADVAVREYLPSEVRRYRALNDLNMTHSSTAFFKTAWKYVGGYRDRPMRIHSEANEDRDFQLRVGAVFPVAVLDYPLAYWRTDSSHGKDF